VGITRVHLEEDTAKLIHRNDPLTGDSISLVDVNRSGVPLMEIVSEPDLRSPEEARQYLVKLRSILRYIGVSTGNMEEGSFRCDANVSIRPVGSSIFGAKVEIKNMNSFRAVQRALEFEVERQAEVLDRGGTIIQETRGWVDEKGITVSQRSKEFAHDYRYFPEPDLPPLTLSPAWIEEMRASLPELPDARRHRFMAEYGLSPYDAALLTESKPFADFFEEAVQLGSGVPQTLRAKAVANWMLGDLKRMLGPTELAGIKLTPGHLADMLDLMDKGVVSGKIAKTVFEEMFNSGKRASEIVAERGLTQISDEQAVAAAIDKVLAANPQAVADFHAGKHQALTFLVGQVMRETRGRANPGLVNKILSEKLR
jgi:aspartyl-tRNA(Asn)/glutamyl-tRNA(Gln) amidotransferase subunit B